MHIPLGEHVNIIHTCYSDHTDITSDDLSGEEACANHADDTGAAWLTCMCACMCSSCKFYTSHPEKYVFAYDLEITHPTPRTYIDYNMMIY